MKCGPSESLSLIKFYCSGFGNFDHPDKNILLGNASVHDIAVTVFPGKTRQTFAKNS